MLYMLFTRTIRDEMLSMWCGHRMVPKGGGACMCMSVTFVDLFVYI